MWVCCDVLWALPAAMCGPRESWLAVVAAACAVLLLFAGQERWELVLSVLCLLVI